MKKTTLVLALFLFRAITINAQVVSTIFGSDANEALTEWDDGTAGGGSSTFNQWIPEATATDGKIQIKGGAIGTMTYTGTYSGTLSSTDIIYYKLRRVDFTRDPQIKDVLVSYKQNGGSTETKILQIASVDNANQELKLTPGFTNGATLSDLSISYSREGDAATSAFDILRLFEFTIGPDPTLSTKSHIIEGAQVFSQHNEIIVKGANLDKIYTITGQEVNNSNLSSGIYLVIISKNDKKATVKIAF